MANSPSRQRAFERLIVALAPLPQGLTIAGLGYVIANAAPALQLQAPIFAALGTVAGIEVLWVVFAMR